MFLFFLFTWQEQLTKISGRRVENTANYDFYEAQPQAQQFYQPPPQGSIETANKLIQVLFLFFRC